jgi:undecaprenyl diphosphate synthase
MLDKERIPKHIAIVMDGNGRWANGKGLPRLAGHNAGMAAMKEIVKHSSILGVKYLTVYAFSTENWKRSLDEVNGIFKLLVLYVEKELNEIHKNNVRVRILGDYSKLPVDAVKSLKTALNKTDKNSGLQFNIALNYGSRDEIIQAIRSIGEDIKSGLVNPENITEEIFADYLFTGEKFANVPDPELVIRTSGEKRLSNYLLWQSAYSEFVFTETLWPDFSPMEYEKAIEEYQNRNRRFGGRDIG